MWPSYGGEDYGWYWQQYLPYTSFGEANSHLGYNSTPCFSAGTQVVTGLDANGQAITRNIEDIHAGDAMRIQ